MQSLSVSLPESFLNLCLSDLSAKLQKLKQLPSQFIARLQKSKQEKLQQISKLLIEFEDLLIRTLRQRIKLIMEIQEQKINIQISELEQLLYSRTQEQTIVVSTMISQIHETQAQSQTEGKSDNKAGSKAGRKVLASIGSGKFQQYWKNFLNEIQEYKLSENQMKYDRQLIQEQIDELIEILNFKLPKMQIPLQSQSLHIQENLTQSKNLPNISQISQRHVGNPSIFSQVHSMLRSKNIASPFSYMKNESIQSVDLETETANAKNKVSYAAIEEYKETKTIKKMENLERRIKEKEKSPEKEVSNLVKLALERKKLLKELEGD